MPSARVLNAARSERLAVGLLLGAILAGSLWLRLVPLRESLWLDELHTAWTVSGTLADVAPRARIGNNSPLYFYLPWLTTRCLGMNELAVRMPTLLAGIVLVAAVYGAVLFWCHSQSMALMAAALAAMDGNFVFYSLEARPYAFVQLVGLLHVIAFWRLLNRSSIPLRMGWIIGTALLFYVHYTAVLLVAAEQCFYLMVLTCQGDRPDYRPTRVIVDLGLSAMLCAPAWGHLVQIAARRENWAAFVMHRPLLALFSVFPLRIYILLPLAVVAVVSSYRWLRQRAPCVARTNARLVLLASCWLFVPLVIFWVTTQTDLARLFLRRYVMVASVAPLVLTACIGMLCPTTASRTVLAVVVISCATLQVRPWSHLVRHENWRDAVATLNADDQYRRQPVFVRSGLVESDALHDGEEASRGRLREYFLLPVRSIYKLDDGNREIIPLPASHAGQLTRDQWQRIDGKGGAWFLIKGDKPTVDRILGQLRATARANGMEFPVAARHNFGMVTLLHITARQR